MSRPPSGRWVAGNRWNVLDGVSPQVPPTVSVVVLHYRQPRELARTLAALRRQTHPSTATEIVVVDDGSPQAPRVPDGVTLLGDPCHRGRRGALRNRGVAAARGEVLCFLDADTAPEPDYLARLTRLPALAPEAVVVGRRRHADLSTVASDAPIAEAGRAHELTEPAWLQEGYAQSHDLLDADDRSYRFVISAVLGCSRWFFAETGGFAEEFDAYGGEDWEWAHRAWQQGALLAHVPDAVAWHDGPDWAERERVPATRRAMKNAEAITLSSRIPVLGSRGRGLRSDRAEIVAVLPPEVSTAAAFVCVDSLLEAMPEAVVLVPATALSAFAGDGRVRGHTPHPDPRLAAARLTIAITAALRVVRAGGLRDACERFTRDRVGVCTVGDDAGALLAITSARHAARVRRWGTAAGFPALDLRADFLSRLGEEPDVEAYLGGWG